MILIQNQMGLKNAESETIRFNWLWAEWKEQIIYSCEKEKSVQLTNIR